MPIESVAIRLIGRRTATASEYPKVLEQIDSSARGSKIVIQGFAAWYAMNKGTLAEQNKRPVTGKILELLVTDALWLAGIRPLYYQARLAQIPDTKYDIFVYHPISPCAISCKSSLGERWKQADLEASAMRHLYRGAYNVLLTVDPKAHEHQRRVEQRMVFGLDQVIAIEEGRTEFDELIVRLKGLAASVAEPVLPVVGRVLTPEGTVVRPRPMGSERRQTRGSAKVD